MLLGIKLAARHVMFLDLLVSRVMTIIDGKIIDMQVKECIH